MYRTHSLNLPAPDSSDFIRRGTLNLRKGEGMIGLRCKFKGKLKNASGAPIDPSAADKGDVLDNFTATLTYAKDGSRKSLADISLKRLRTIIRDSLGSEIFNWSNTSTSGLANQIAAGASEQVGFHIVIPTFSLWQVPELRDKLAIGRSQAKTIEVEIKWVSGKDTLDTASLTVDTTAAWTVDVFPDVVPLPFDRFCWLPEYREANISDFKYTFSDGLPTALWERSTPHASTTLTKINLKVGDHEIERDSAPADMIARRDGLLSLGSEQNVEDEVTRLYGLLPGQHLRNVPAGELYVEQPNQDMATMKLGILAFPVVDESEVAANVEYIATYVASRAVKAVNALTHEGIDVPEALTAFQPFDLLTSDDPGYQKFPGLGCDKGGKAAVYIPDTGLNRARAAIAAHKASGEHGAAADSAKQVARYVPGAAMGSKGFQGGKTLTAIVNALGL